MASQLPPGTLIASVGRVKAPAPVVREEHKALGAYRTITEVAAELGVASHVLRFWESRFPQIKPLKKSGGRRYYKADDIQLLRQIQHLLYDQGMTIRGVQAQLGKAKKAKVASTQLTDTVWMVKELRRIRQVLAGEE
jgi:DNA-binding transcriptional MerR regulator